MSSLENHPIYTLVFLLLLISYLHISKYSAGKILHPKQVIKFACTEGNLLWLDIRDPQRFNRFHIDGSINDPNPLNYPKYQPSQSTKLVLVYDSNIALEKYQNTAKIEQYPRNIYHVFMPDYQAYIGRLKPNTDHFLVTLEENQLNDDLIALAAESVNT